MKLGEMTWPEIDDLDRERFVALYPIASFEQHGDHLPLLTDTLECEGITAAMDRRVGDRIVVLPTQWLGYSFHHIHFGGSLTATSRTHVSMVVETIDGLVRAGFHNILILNGHGGNQADMRVALQELRERHMEARVYGASWWEAAQAGLDEVRTAGPDGSGHAGETETSLMLHLHPGLVRTDRMTRGGVRAPSATRGPGAAVPHARGGQPPGAVRRPHRGHRRQGANACSRRSSTASAGSSTTSSPDVWNRSRPRDHDTPDPRSRSASAAGPCGRETPATWPPSWSSSASRSCSFALVPHRDDAGLVDGVPGALARIGARVVSGMFGTVGEDYTTMETIRRTGGLVPDEHWEANRQVARQAAGRARELGLPSW